MRTKQVDIYQRYTPIPIAVLITAANCFDCDIYICLLYTSDAADE